MSSEEKQIARFSLAMERVGLEGQQAWQIFGAFLLVHVVYLGLTLNGSTGTLQFPLGLHNTFVAAILGLLMCLPWYATTRRAEAFYAFRMAQARECEPDNWQLVGGKAHDFAEGKAVSICDKTFRLGFWSRVLRTRRAAVSMISIFALTYFLIAAITGPWMLK